MIRLVLMLSIGAACAGGVAVSEILSWAVEKLTSKSEEMDDEPKPSDSKAAKTSKATDPLKPRALNMVLPTEIPTEIVKHIKAFAKLNTVMHQMVAGVTLTLVSLLAYSFYQHSSLMSEYLSEPQLMMRGRGRNGGTIIIDDFREAYWWVRDNTPKDSRIMSWWDYGYQLNGIAERISIADGNTWNHEHIALLGKCLISNETASWEITRHLADYVLIWTTRYAGMMGDDLAKSPHMANIGGSVYHDVPREGYWVDREDNPSPLMKQSLLYKMHTYKIHKNHNPVIEKYFEHVHDSPNRMVRVFKVKNIGKRYPPNYGKYSPEILHIIAQKHDFDQVHGK